MQLKIDSLDAERKKIIINAAIDEFSEHSYKYSSTDNITVNANISKGSLFNYFGSKKKMYFYVFDFAVETLANEYIKNKETITSEKDIIKRLFNIVNLKFAIINHYPSFFDFMLKAVNETDPEIGRHVKAVTEKLKNEYIPEIYSNIDFSVLREDIDKTMISKFINWIIDGYSLEVRNTMKTEKKIYELFKEKINDEMQILTELMRKLFYK